MPELPEVETVLRGLEQVVGTTTIASVTVHCKKLRTEFPKGFAKDITGQKITAYTRRAKYMLLTLSNQKILIVHLGMSGSFIVHPTHKTKNLERGKHDHVEFILGDGTVIFYHDPRRFGVMDVVAENDIDQHKFLKHLGYEPLLSSFTGKVLHASIAARKVPIKQAIMDQKIVVGVGNIYASEALFRAGIDPTRSANNVSESECALLVKEIKSVLKKAIAAGGSTLKDYRKVGGEAGNFQAGFTVYGRAGKACPNCTCNVDKTGGIKRIVQGGRSTFYCPRKQS